jgi:hypothetical protein
VARKAPTSTSIFLASSVSVSALRMKGELSQLHHLGPHHLVAVGLRRCIGEMGSSVFG